MTFFSLMFIHIHKNDIYFFSPPFSYESEIPSEDIFAFVRFFSGFYVLANGVAANIPSDFYGDGE